MMLRKIEGLGATGFRRMDWDAAAEWARRALGFGALAGAMALLCRAQPVGGLAPFAMAFLAAALLAGWSAAALLTGCMLGAVNGGIRDFNLALPVGAAIVLGSSIAGDMLLPGLRRRTREWRHILADRLSRIEWLPERLWERAAIGPAPRRQARSPNRELASCAALAGLGVLIPGLVRANGDFWPSAQTLGAALAAVAAAPFIRLALAVRPERRVLSREERLGLFLLACMLAAGLAAVCMPAALCLCGALALALYPCGALAGAGLGAALMLMGGDARLLALTVAGGASAQLCAGMSRRAREGVFFAAMLLSALFLNVSASYLAGAGAAVLAAAPLPGRWLYKIEGWARPRGDPARRRGARRLRAETGAVCAPRETGMPSGDSHVIRLLDGERLLALICDGMGSGEAAAAESALAVRLLTRLLAGGAEYAQAIARVNALLMNRGGEDMFATVDMLILNLRTGGAELVKLAASPTLILRDGEACWVEGGRLPLGIVENARPGVSRARLMPGDVLLMASDGVMDAAETEELEAIMRGGDSAETMARRALAAAERAEHRDDRTAICIRLGVRR